MFLLPGAVGQEVLVHHRALAKGGLDILEILRSWDADFGGSSSGVFF